MIAASVDDLPEPVGPVTSTMPFFSDAMSASAAGRLSSPSVGIFDAMTRMTIAKRAALAEDVDAETGALGKRVGQVAGALILERAQGGLVVADDVAGDARGVSARAVPASSLMSTGDSSPCFSTCGGRPGEKIRSLMPLPESSIAPITTGVRKAGGAAGSGPNRRSAMVEKSSVIMRRGRPRARGELSPLEVSATAEVSLPRGWRQRRERPRSRGQPRR